MTNILFEADFFKKPANVCKFEPKNDYKLDYFVAARELFAK